MTGRSPPLSDAGGDGSRASLRGTVFAEGGCGPQDRWDIAIAKEVDRTLVFQPCIVAQHERLLHPGIQMSQCSECLLEAFDCSRSGELPGRIAKTVPPCVQSQ